MDYFRQLEHLLKAEREEDRDQYRLLIQRSSIHERRADGLCWYPVAVRGTDIARGDYLVVELERTTHRELPHQLRFGMPAALFSNHDPNNDRLDGIIAHVGDNRLRLTMRVEELPDWVDQGKLGVDLLFDENSYQEMFAALKAASNNPTGQRHNPVVDVLVGDRKPAFTATQTAMGAGALNPSQTEAVQLILAAEDLAIVHGPPGTGKTTTLVEAIVAMVHAEKEKILVTAPSNTAVDLLSDRIAARGVNVLRVGNPARVSERLVSLTLDSRMDAHPHMKEIRRLKKQANEFRNMAHKYKRNFGKAEREQRKALFDEARRIMKDVGTAEQYIIDDIVSRAEVVTATLVGANHHTTHGLRFHTVVIDEAGQALEPAAWIPILKGRKVIMAGDPFQLPPTVKSEQAARGGFTITLLEKAIRKHPDAVVLLEEQYRMHHLIAGYSSKVFYEGRLHAHGSVADTVLFEGDQPLVFVDTAGCGYEEKMEGTSASNPEEASFLLHHLEAYVSALAAEHAAQVQIAVISPYRQQIEVLKELLHDFPTLVAVGQRLSINTIDSFQGQERDVVYISMTRSNSEGAIGFLSDVRRMNVAMTRARKKLVVVGDSATLSQLPFYLNFIEYAQQHGAYHSAWEFII